MSDVLAEICAEKRTHVARSKAALPEADLRAQLDAAPPLRPFAAALENRAMQGRYGLIAEIKKASPSRGLIRAENAAFDDLIRIENEILAQHR